MLSQNWSLFHQLKHQVKNQSRLVRTLGRVPKSKSNDNDDDLQTSNNITTSENILDQETECNYLGINEKQDSEIVHGEYVFDSAKHQQQIREKYDPLLRPNKMHTTGNRQKINSLSVRFDSENQPTFHGEFEKRDELVYKNLQDVIKHINSFEINPVKSTNNFNSLKIERDITVDEVIEHKPTNTIHKSIINHNIQFRYANSLFKPKQDKKQQDESEKDDWITFERSKREGKPSSKPEMSLSEKMARVKFEQPETDTSSKPNIITAQEYLNQIRSGKRDATHFQKEFDELKKLIPKEKLDTKGYRILSNQVPNFFQMTNQDVLEMLEKQILFNDEDIVAINKPYGIAVHGAFGDQIIDSSHLTNKSTSRVNCKYNHIIHLMYFLPKLAERLECSKLFTVHRLDRDTTGVLLFTKTQKKAQQLNQLFKEHKIEKRYLCITKNRPDIPEGIINIPIEMGYIKSPDGKKRERMVLCPEPLESVRLQRRWRTAKQAITHYKIKSDHGNAALLEVTPETGIRHQIRVHLGFGLRCPILGDHKYSNLDSLSPQKLPSDILMALRIRQAKSRSVPMHLHSYLMMIPQAGKDGRNIFIRAPLPYHFRQNMHSLKLTLD